MRKNMATLGIIMESGKHFALLAAMAVAAFTAVPVRAQAGDISSPAPGLPAALQTYRQEQQALAQEWQTLISQGATMQQLEAWRQQHAARIQAQQQRAQALALASALQPIPVIAEAIIPADASSNLEEFLTTQATLANARARIHNQLLQSLPSGATQEQVSAMRQQEQQIFQQQHSADLQLQKQQAQALANTSAPQPLPAPGSPVVLPPNAPPQLKAYISARDALLSARAQIWNQYVTADPAARQAAMQQWQQQNAGQLNKLRQLARALSNSTTNQ